jgi:hypothetical protein
MASMADATADRLNLAIAQGAPSVNFSPLSSLLGDYVAGKQLAQRAGTIDAFQNGVPQLADGTPDYNAMAKTYYQLGDVNTATQLARLAAQRASLQFAGDQSNAAPGAGGNPNFNINPQAGGYPNFNVNQQFAGAPAMPGQRGAQNGQQTWTDPATNKTYVIRNGHPYLMTP